MSGKRLPQVGEVWFRRDGGVHGPLMRTRIGIPYSGSHFLCADGGYTWTGFGRFSEDTNIDDYRDLVLIHKDASGKVIHATFDPSLIGKDEAERPAKPTPDPLAQAIAAADDQAKGLRERQAVALAIRENADAGKTLREKHAALVAKYPIPGDKAKPKAKKR